MSSTTIDTWQQNWDNAIEGCASLINAISFKKFKHMASLSEETECFTADVMWNGKVVAYASNCGHGGSTNIHFTDPVARVAMTNAVADALTKAGVPADFLGFDAVVDEAVNEELNRRDMEKQRKAFAKKCHARGHHMIVLESGTMMSVRPCLVSDSTLHTRSYPDTMQPKNKDGIHPFSKVVAVYLLPLK
jgi:hypothetical protein